MLKQCINHMKTISNDIRVHMDGPIWVAIGEKNNVDNVKIIISDSDTFQDHVQGMASLNDFIELLHSFLSLILSLQYVEYVSMVSPAEIMSSTGGIHVGFPLDHSHSILPPSLFLVTPQQRSATPSRTLSSTVFIWMLSD